MFMFKNIFWNLYAFCYDSLLGLNPYSEMLSIVASSLHLKSGENILNAGCGTGNLEILIAGNNSQTKIVSIDFSESMLKRAKNKCDRFNNITFQEIDMNDTLPFPDQEFDKIVSVNALYALENPEKTMQEFARVLKRNGILTLVTPKKGCSAPLILKAHRHKNESEELWRGDSFLKWLRLVFRAFGMSKTALKFTLVAIFNKKLFKTMKVFESAELEKILMRNGLDIVHAQLIYGNQNLFLIAKRRL